MKGVPDGRVTMVRTHCQNGKKKEMSKTALVRTC
jgi:hypothetical protein